MVASEEDYRQALMLIIQNGRLPEIESLRILGFQYRCHQQTITSKQLMNFLKVDHARYAILHYEAMARTIAQALDHNPKHKYEGELLWSFTVSSVHDESPISNESEYRLKLWPALVRALDSLHWFDFH